MQILLFIFYAVLLCWILTRRPFFRDFRPGLLIAFFALRVAAGCLHNWVAWHYYPNHGDIWVFFQNSEKIIPEMLQDHKHFIAENSTLNYIRHNLVVWIHVGLNFLSFNNLYINTLLFSFLTLGGQIALFRVFFEKFGRDALSACMVLLLPSILFWTSCIHIEGIIYAMLGGLFYTFHRGLKDGWTRSLVVRGVVLTALPILFRPALAIGLLPALIIWAAFEMQIPRRTLLAVTATLVILVAGISFASPAARTIIPQTLSQRQNEFQTLEGNSRIPLPVLRPDWTSLNETFPRALFNGWFEPLPGSGGQKVYLAFSLELLSIWAIILIALLRIFVLRPRPLSSGDPNRTSPYPPSTSPGPLDQPPLSTSPGDPAVPPPYPRPLATASLVLALLSMLLIGLIIPFVGAIVRYRSIYLPFLLIPFLASFGSLRIYRVLNNRLTRLIFK